MSLCIVVYQYLIYIIFELPYKSKNNGNIDYRVKRDNQKAKNCDN